MNPRDLIHPGCPDFKWYEVWKSPTADRLHIDNVSTDPEVIQTCQKFVLNLGQPLRNDVGVIRPQSWFRCEELERDICWTSFCGWCEKYYLPVDDYSWDLYFQRKSHPLGGTVDIEVNSMSNDDLFDHIKKNYEFDQLIREFPRKGIPYSGWVHVSWADKNTNRNQAFTIGAK